MTIDTKRLKTDAAYWDEVAPERATHYNGGLANPWLKESPESYYTDYSGWVAYIENDNAVRHFSNAIPRPTKPAAPEWDGDGLPPVGCECEHWGSGGHESVKVLAHAYKRTTGKVVVFQKQDDSITYSSPEFFRPLRTKEQRQREELAKLVREAYLEGASEHVGGLTAITDAILARYNLEPKP